MNFWNHFIAFDNFLLAWRRINTGSNASYKRFFREAYLAYEVSINANIECLIKRIKGGVYEPKPPDRIFVPKPILFQRPISILTIEDQIVWQAIANILELKWKAKRIEVEKKVVFSNHHSPNRIFFFESWKTSYNRFLKRIEEIHKENKWTAHFDLAAYFDTISHDHISNLLTPRNKNSEIARFIKTVLHAWSAEKPSKRYSHGIPQGPIASAYIGEIIFLDIDKPMMSAQDEFFYLRYVDDVRLFAKDEDRVREGIIHLEQLCRDKGLVPQTKKTAIFRAESVIDAIGKDISISPEEYIKPAPDEYLHSSVDARNVEITNTTKFKHYLFRGIANPEYLDLVLALFVKYPDLSDGFVHYLSNFKGNEVVIKNLIDIIKRKRFPYQYVEGNVWLLLSIIDANQSNSELLSAAIKRVLLPASKVNPYLRHGLLMYLAPYAMKLGKRVFNRYLYEESAVFQSLLLPAVAHHFSFDKYLCILRQCFLRSKPEAGLAASSRLGLDNIKFDKLGVSRRQNAPIRNCLVALGLLKSRILPNISPFQEVFHLRYKIEISDWRLFLKGQYRHAHRILILAERAFCISKSSWLCSMDSFNEILTRALIRADKSIKQKLVEPTTGKLVKYGVLLQGHDFKTKYNQISSVFYDVHKRRCSIPETHPYEQETAKKTTFLRSGEQHHYYGQLRRAYIDLDTAFHTL